MDAMERLISRIDATRRSHEGTHMTHYTHIDHLPTDAVVGLPGETAREGYETIGTLRAHTSGPELLVFERPGPWTVVLYYADTDLYVTGAPVWELRLDAEHQRQRLLASDDSDDTYHPEVRVMSVHHPRVAAAIRAHDNREDD